MSILLTENTSVLIQGITGKEGLRALTAMRAYHTRVPCGVTPGKGGHVADGAPVFETVRDALTSFPETTVSAIYVPPAAAKAAILEALEAGITLVNVMTEKMPLKDAAYCLAAARERGARIIGPGSLGCLVPGIGRLGVVGGPLVDEIYAPGPIGVISRSGGMTNELSWLVRQAGLGQSTAVHVGGELLIGTTYADVLKEMEADPTTKAVVIYAEQGVNYEREIVSLLQDGGFTKPLAVHIGGAFAETLPSGTVVGHAGAIVGKGQSAREKMAALQDAGALVAERFEDLVELIHPTVHA
ncbi:MAG: succinate--CoA ligase subunit alpha [Patescibacteria group bacterium]|jgi:succinyl-CoA synthetase alpha subunit